MIATYTKDRNYEVLLCEYAAGTLDETCSLIVATHMTLCHETREIVHSYECIGGACLDICEEEDISKNLLEDVLSRLDNNYDEAQQETQKENSSAISLGFSVPRTLERYIFENSEMPLKWKKALPGMSTYDLPIEGCENAARIIKMEPGASVPTHGHGGQELTLIIDGAMTDEHGTYNVGDLIIQDAGFEHTPTAHKEYGCVCLAVSCAPIKLKGIASLLNPFLSK